MAARIIVIAGVLAVLLRCTVVSGYSDQDTDICASSGLFRCGVPITDGHWCISQAWVCDGESDCPDGSDEPPSCSPVSCAPDKFQCHDQLLCIPSGWLCDGEADCVDQSDEQGQECTDNDFHCRPDEYRCDGTRICLHLDQLCDGVSDCPDSIDEGAHCRSVDCSGVCPSGSKCRKSFHGPRCHCSNGQYFNVTSRTCDDIDECAYDGYCDQLCSNLPKSSKCDCKAGYRLVNGTRCAAVTQTNLLVASSHGIALILPNGTVMHNTKADGDIKMADFTDNDSSFCFLNSSSAELNCVVNGSGVVQTIQTKFSLSTVLQMAHDWVSLNWYFTDDQREKIFVCGNDGAVCVNLLYIDLKAPHSVVVDPVRDRLFFTTHGDSPSVQSTSLIGLDRKWLVTSKQIVRPLGLTVDCVNEHVYWSDSYLDRIERINYDGSNRQLVARHLPVKNLNSLAVYDNFIYVTTQLNHTVVRINRFHHVLSDDVIVSIRNVTTPLSVKSYQCAMQRAGQSSPCKHSPCNHICVARLASSSPNTTCLCMSGYRLNSDGLCQAVSEEKFLVYSNAKHGEIKAISLEQGLSATNKSHITYEAMVPVAGLGRPVALDFHRKTQHIYFSDVMRHTISRRIISGTEIETVIDGVLNCEGIAIDWYGDNIYWTDEGLKTISVARLDNTTIRRTLFNVDITHPRAIVVHPNLGLMFWTDWVEYLSSQKSKIERANMDGSERSVWVVDHLHWPNGLSVDYASNRLYWCDAYYDRIEGVSLMDKNARIVFANFGMNVRHPYGLVHYSVGGRLQSFFWTEFTIGQIMRFDVAKNESAVVYADSVLLFDIILVDTTSSSQTGSSVCSTDNGNCDHLCLSPAHQHQKVCLCADGYEVSVNDSTQCTPLKGGQSVIDTSLNGGCPHFLCDNGNCINTHWLCDGDDDCGDMSDESQEGVCKNFTCSGDGLYTCSNNRCIYLRWLCDGEDDCRTGEDEDESNCPNVTCAPHEIKCPTSNQCISSSWICDGDLDCEDGFDETNCPHVQCKPDEFMCRNHHCISHDYYCDGDADCDDNSDEEDCNHNTTSCTGNDQFLCLSTWRCIDRSKLCDGHYDCGVGDVSDEALCPELLPPLSPLLCSNGLPLSRGDFMCNSSRMCVPGRVVCDGFPDCEDSSDEIGCNVTTIACAPVGEYKCPGENKCIPSHWVCDYDEDCQDSSDESNCSVSVTCEMPDRHCRNDSMTCVKALQLCDGVADCSDASDEGGHCDLNLCSISNLCEYRCQTAPDGYVCTCKPGEKLNADGVTCSSASPCLNWGICSQNCSEDWNQHYHCFCQDNYELASDKFTCKPKSDAKTYILFSNRHEIRQLDIHHETYVSLVSGLRNTIALDFYYNHSSSDGENSIIFWSDVVDDKIYKGSLILNSATNIDTVVNYGIATAEGLAVDWITEHLYWVESNLDQIEVADFSGNNRLTLVSGFMDSPRAIALDPHVGLLFWTDWDRQYPRIERSTMSGDSRSVIVNVTSASASGMQESGWPNGIVVDYELQRLYWIDARSDSIHTSTYDGSDLREVLKGHEFLSHPFAVSVFGNNVFWSDWRTNSLIRANKWNGTNVQLVERTITQPFDLHIFHPFRQPTFSNPCAPDKTKCVGDAVCLLTADHQTACRCPHMTESVSETACAPVQKFLLVARKQEIRGVYIDNPYFSVIPVITTPNVFNPIAVDFVSNGDGSHIYWTEAAGVSSSSKRGVHRAGILSDTIDVIDSGTQNPHGFAVDWISRNLYFSGSSRHRAFIAISKLDGAYRRLLDIPSVNLQNPISLAVHPMKGLLFWSDATLGSIFASYLDGRQVLEIYHSNGSISSNLSIDYINNELWWNVLLNDNTSQIMHCMLGNPGSSICVPAQFQLDDTVNSLTALTVDNGTVYFAFGKDRNTIEKVNIDGSHRTVLREQTSDVRAMKIFVVNRYSQGNLCSVSNGDCSQLCIPLPKSRVCYCATGFQLNPHDQVTCEGIDSFITYSNVTEIVGISVNESDTETQALAPISRIELVVATDFHVADNDIYWVDSHARTIQRIRRDLTSREVLISTGILSVEGVAVDWIAGNMYWTDSGQNCIEVSRLNGSHRYVVVHSDEENPKDIVVDPINGYMYWTVVGNEPKIKRGRLDGTDQVVLVNVSAPWSISSPGSIALDYDNNQLYWCDETQGKLNSIDLKSLVGRTVVTHISTCAGVSILGDFLYWIDSSLQGGSIIRADKLTGTGHTIIRSDLGHYVKNLAIFDSSRQPPAPNNPCRQNNGGCSELCLFNGTAPACYCSHGRRVNNTQCANFDIFLAFSKVTGIETVHMTQSANGLPNLNSPRPPVENATRLRNVIGLAFDFTLSRYFFSDIQRGDIQSVSFEGNNFEVIVNNIGSVEGLAYDEIFQELYWTSYTNSSISRVSIRLPQSSRVVEKMVQLTADDHPRAIVIDSCQSRMYWTNWNDNYASIMRSRLSGADVEKIIAQDIQTPNGLTIDHRAQKLYWSDAHLDKIERCSYDGTGRKIVVHGYPQHVFGLTVYGDHLYWTDWLLRAVLSANKYTGSDITYLRKNIVRQPMGIIAVSKDANECSNDACSTMSSRCQQRCAVDAYGVANCACNSGFVLNSDRTTCRPANVMCSFGQFACISGQCVDIEDTCNGSPDCQGEDDEDSSYCKTRLCPTGYFRCSNGRCIEMSKKCDRSPDCGAGDRSDEDDCPCNPHSEFQCATGKRTCIKSVYRCDQEKDCPDDASDEMGCPEMSCRNLLGDSGNRQVIHCNRTTACIFPSWICDGHNDCWDNEDEENCSLLPTPVCDVGWRPCKTGGGCVVNSWWCDGDQDCYDGSDESNCTVSCSGDKILCDGNRCIAANWRCDGHSDCVDRSDERNCAGSCSPDDFHCTSSADCIPKSWQCDGETDCPGGEDEHPQSGCKPRPCDADEFQCHNWQCVLASFFCDGVDDCGDASDEPEWCEPSTCNNSTKFSCLHTSQCIDIDKRCNGKPECLDQSDEDETLCAKCNTQEYMCNGKCVDPMSFCARKETCSTREKDDILRRSCGVNECRGHPCSEDQVCVDKPIGFECQCRRGFQLASDGHTCVDINECDKHICSQLCINTVGSYRCDCAPDYKLTADKLTCKAAVAGLPKPVLLISNRYYLRNVSLNGSVVELLASDLQNAIALDFDWQEQYIYWSDVMSTGSNISRMFVNGTGREVLHSSTLRNPDGLAVDWIGRNLYWCDKTTDTIEVSRLNGLYRRVLVDTDLQEPRAIAVHPFLGYLFYTDWGDDAHIGRLGMDGSQRTRIVNKDMLGWPNALTIDYMTNEIIWADAKLDYIAISDVNASNIRYLLGGHLPHIFGIATFEDYIYWTDWEHKSIERASRRTGSRRRNVTNTIHQPMGIQVFHPLRQPIHTKKDHRNPCANHGGCGNGTLCLIKPGGRGRVCACPERHYLSADKTTCISNCTSSEFACATTYKCIPFWWKCDGVDDCGDRSDEPPDCRPYVCRQPQLFQCSVPNPSSLDCISPLQICDGTAQCNDSSDEQNCEAHTCLESQFKCQGQEPRCIPATLVCNGGLDCSDGADEKSCPVHVCSWNQFECDNKHCIPYVWRCDGDDDCGDWSDETGLSTNCSSTPCPDGYLRCEKSGRCVPLSWRCDGDLDCGEDDPSDEPDDCLSATCEPTYFKCNNSRCIPGRWHCDYDDDCNDGSDELNCIRRNCSESEFRCHSDGRCLRKIVVCDGIAQCADHSDEDPNLCNSTAFSCPDPSYFRCAGSTSCFPQDWKCDGERDCIDASDEANCQEYVHRCGPHELRCGDGVCIPRSWWCDGVADCLDKSDELPHICTANWTCEPGFMRCNDNRCILRDFLCDGVKQCLDGSDEENCGAMICQKTEWRCNSGECISQDRLCDGVFDCMDESDEGMVCQTNRTCVNNENCPPPYVCRRIPVRTISQLLEHFVRQLAHFKTQPQLARCSCPDGQRMTLSGRCEKRDPCGVFGQCSQRCHANKNICACDSNYVAVPHNGSISCIAKGHRPYVVLLSDFEIYTVSPNNMSSFIRRFPPERSSRVLNHELKMTSADYVISGESATLFIASQSEGAVYRYNLPLKFGYPLMAKSRSRVHRTADNVGMMRITLPQQSNIGGIAVDWVSEKIYWTESGPTNSRVAVSGLNGTWQKTLINTTLHRPAAIAVDPESMQIFWTTLGVLHARIESAALNGTGRQVLVQSKIIWPTDLCIDYPNRRLYWTDEKKRTVESIRLDGSDRRVVWAFALNGTHTYQPYKIDIFEDSLYILIRDPLNVLILDKFGRYETGRELLPAQSPIPLGGLLVVQQLKKNMNLRRFERTNPCLNFACDEARSICFNTEHGASCLLPDDGPASRVELSKITCYNYCQNRGICTVTEMNEPKCQCTDQFTGRRCEDDICHGSCVMENTESCRASGKGGSPCICKPEFEGLRCDHNRCEDYCTNGGTCTFDAMVGQPKCRCLKEFTGPQCKSRRRNACDGVTCYNGGRCRATDEAYLEYTCDCGGKYSGPHCELCKIQPCSGPDCAVHTCNSCASLSSCNSHYSDLAYCSVLANTSFTCHCSPGYRLVQSCARICPLCVDSCDGYCLNGGSCRHQQGTGNPLCSCDVPYYGQQCGDVCGSCNINGTRSCNASGCDDCKDGWEGRFCETMSCGCRNKGTCISQVENLGCICPLGYGGHLCEVHVGCDVVHCLNGGTCVESYNTYYCNCPDGFSGDLCNMVHVSAGSSRTTLVVVLISLFIILLAVFVVLAVLVYRRRSTSGLFKHQRMESDTDGANVEITNPVYMRDYEDVAEDEVMDENLFENDKPTNFANPVYDSMFAEADADAFAAEGGSGVAEESRLLSQSSSNKKRKKNKSSPRHSTLPP